jgi:gliding motility-associated-like protein
MGRALVKFAVGAVLGLMMPRNVQAQPYWAKVLGGPGNDLVRDVKTDSAGFLYLTGEFSGTIAFGGGTYQSSGGIDMFLAKMTPEGQVVWFEQGGGPGIDRGNKLAVANGKVAVVGTFMQTAGFQGQELISAGGPDIFLAMHDAATGTLQWLACGGGPTASDRPYGVSIAASGSVAMVGEFSDTVTIAGEQLTSTMDPQTLAPGVDVFIANYSPAGVPLWVRQGAAKYTDRAIDVVHDPAGNIYTTGQFSDTIQFIAQHPNVMYNAIFLLKLDPAGNEVWFRRMGGAVYNQVRDMQWTGDNDLVMVGDLQGTMIYLDSVPTFISSGDPYAYYLARIGGDGSLHGDTVVTSMNPVSGRALDERNGLLTVLGQFQCQFTSMVDSAHAGLWMATGDPDLFVVRHFLDSLVIKDAQQFGGRQEKLAGQVTTLNDGSPVFCGSYEDMIVFPCMGQFNADIHSIEPPYDLMASSPLAYCGDAYHGAFAADTSRGLNDGFVARGYVVGRSPYDWWNRNDTTCSYLPDSVCLGMGYEPTGCVDTAEFCGEGIIGVDPHFSFSPVEAAFFVGPELDFLWSTGATTDSIGVTSSGTYWVTCTSVSGCFQWTDTIVVIIHPFPPQPLLSDDIPVASNSPDTYQIDICDPGEVWLWCSNVDTSTTYFWTGGNLGGAVYNDSIPVDTGGTFMFSMVTDFGCTRQNDVLVIDHPNEPIPNVSVNLHIIYPQDQDLNDTVSLCPQQDLAVYVEATWMLNGQPYSFPYTDPPTYYFGFVFGTDTMYRNDDLFMGSFPVYTSQWFVDTVSIFIINSPCGNDTLSLPDVAIDSVYALILPATDVDIGLAGPALICPGDTALLVATCPNCDNITWQGDGLLYTAGDSAYGQGGYYQATGWVVDTNGCSFAESTWHQVTYPSVPLLDVFPPDGIICPDSVAIIYTDAVGSFTWYGPEGDLGINNDSIIVNTPGEYYLALVDPNGCYLISDPILITGYATPFLNVLPDGVLCVGEAPITLQVVTTGYSSLAWAPPLSGNSLMQLVDEPGIYSCSVQACGITTELNTEVIAGEANAEVLDPGPFDLCPGDTVVLLAAGGQAIYFWDPGPVVADSLVVSQPGSYTLMVQDAHGCADTAAAVVVTAHDFGAPPSTTDQVVCVGTPVVLQESAGGNLTWFADSALSVVLGTGPVLDLGTPSDSVTVYLVQSDSLCTSLPHVVHVDVVQPPTTVLLYGPDTVCAGEDALLVAANVDPFENVWTTPNGTAVGDSLGLWPAGAADSGWYTVSATASGCSGEADSLYLTVVTPMSIDLGPDSSICPGMAITFQVPPGFSDAVWQQGIPGSSFTMGQSGTVFLAAADTNGCTVHDEVLVTVLAPDIPVSANDLTLCHGEDAIVVANGSGDLTWYADSSLTIAMGTGDTLLIPMPADSLTVFVVQDQFGCAGGPLPVSVNVVQIPVDVDLVASDPFCLGAPASISATGPPGLEGTWHAPSGTYSMNPLSIPSVAFGDSGWYVLVPMVAGCIGPADSIHIAVLVPEPLDLGEDTTVCIGGSLFLSIPDGFSDPQWSTGDTSLTIEIFQGGAYSVEATDLNGCLSSDLVQVEAVECPPLLPTVISPNGDGLNDGLVLGLVGAVDGEIVIYNRWGQVVHTGNPISHPWTCNHDRNGEPVPDGVYYYVLRLTDHSGSTKEYSGYFNILR